MSEIFADRYESTGQEFNGGGGQVFVCHDPNLDRLVVVKFMLEGVEFRRVQDEVSALQAVRSKNVVQVLDVVDDADLGIGIVSEFLSGADLTDTSGLSGNRSALLRTIFQLANGLADLHEYGIVHRDLKPNNVKFDEEGILKIFDFNLAKLGEAPGTVGFRGTYGYAAPEQYGMGHVRITSAMDVYALAVTAVYLLCDGKIPRPLGQIPPRPDLWPNGVRNLSLIDTELADLLDGALELNPKRRPKAAAIRDLARDLICRDKHRATIVVCGQESTFYLDSSNRTARIANSKSGGGVIVIHYDGLRFFVQQISNSVLINHVQCSVGQSLPDCCVIDLGSASGAASDRLFVTFDVSHPEVAQ
jgi:serine/threonine-protein kinase